jgi:putative transcriptional regulator
MITVMLNQDNPNNNFVHSLLRCMVHCMGIRLKLACLSKIFVEGFFVLFGETLIEVFKMLRSRIGDLLRVSKYRREYIIKQLDISQNTLSNWCVGKTFPTMDKAFILADLLEVKVDDLYDRHNPDSLQSD